MADLPAPPPTTYKDQYVPLEERESRNISPLPYIRDYTFILGLTAIGAFLGRMVGKNLEPRNIKLGTWASWKFGTPHLDRRAGLIAGTEIGGIYGLFHHWRKTEGKRLSVSNINSDLKTAIDPAQLQKEAEKEKALLADMQKLEEKLARPASHAEGISRRRETQAEQGLG